MSALQSIWGDTARAAIAAGNNGAVAMSRLATSQQTTTYQSNREKSMSSSSSSSIIVNSSISSSDKTKRNEIDYRECCANCGEAPSSFRSLLVEGLKTSKVPFCGHRFCKTCLHRDLLLRKVKFICPVPGCAREISTTDLSDKSLDEIEAEIDISNRRKLRLIFNKTVHDFVDLDAFHAYEEMVEDYIFNLNTKTALEETWKSIEEYKQQNDQMIYEHNNRQQEDEEALQQKIMEEIEVMKRRQYEHQQREQEQLSMAKESKKRLNSAMLGDINTSKPIDNNNPGNSSTSASTMQQQPKAAVDFVQLFLSQRPLPQMVAKSAAAASTSIVSKQDIRASHAASGYNHSECLRRNWQKVISDLRTYQRLDASRRKNGKRRKLLLKETALRWDNLN